MLVLPSFKTLSINFTVGGVGKRRRAYFNNLSAPHTFTWALLPTLLPIRLKRMLLINKALSTSLAQKLRHLV